MSVATQKNLGFQLTVKGAVGGTTVDSEVDGAWIDRQGFMGVTFAVAGQAVLAAAETLQLSGNFQDADDAAGNGAADFGTAQTATTIQTGGAGTEVPFAGKVSQDLTAARRYIRFQSTLATSSSGTATYAAMYILYGKDENS